MKVSATYETRYAVDVYDRGQMTAGYQYTTIDECQAELASVLGRHLVMPSQKK